MNKILAMVITVLAVSVMAIPLAMAVVKEPYWAEHEMDMFDPGKTWMVDGVLQVKDSYWKGTNEGSMGAGTLEIWFEHETVNSKTGEGTATSKIKVTIPGKGTIEGIARGKITGGGAFGSGIFLGTHGTGDFEGLTVTGSWEAIFTTATHAHIDCVGISAYH